MDGLFQDRTLRSQLVLLVSQQRYEDVLALLNRALAQNPQDRVACLFRLLVARIFVLHQRLDSHQASLMGLSKHRISHVLERSTHASLSALRAAQAGFARWLLTLYAGYRLELSRLSGRDRSRRRVSQRLQELYAIVYATTFEIGKTVALGAQKRLRTAWSQRAVLMLSVVGFVSIITALCGILLTDFVTRSPAVAQAPGAGAKPKKVVGPAVPSAAPLSGLEIQPAQEKPSTLGSAEDQPSRARGDLREDAMIRPVAERSEAEPLISKAALRAPSDIKRKSDAAATNPALNTARVENNKPALIAPSPATARSDEKKSPLKVAGTTASTHYRTRQPIAIRKAARFGAPAVEQLEAGASVAVLDVKDSWAKVLLNGESTGFVRIEFLAPAP